MKVKFIEDIDKEILCESSKNIVIAGSREQGKSDILIRKILCDIKDKNLSSEEILILVVDKNQRTKMINKLEEHGVDNNNRIKVMTYSSFFYKVYSLLHSIDEIPNRLIFFRGDSIEDKEIIGALMEEDYIRSDMTFGEFSATRTWEQYEKFSYLLNLPTGALQTQPQKITKFCSRFHQTLKTKGLMNSHYMSHLLTKLLSQRSRYTKLLDLKNTIKRIYCDDMHYLLLQEWRNMERLLNFLDSAFVAVLDLYFTPRRILGIDGERVRIRNHVRDTDFKILILKETKNLEWMQDKVYALLKTVIEPLIPLPLRTEPEKKTIENTFGEDELTFFGQIAETDSGFLVLKLIGKLIQDYNKGNSVALFYYHCPHIISLVEAILTNSNIPFYTNHQESFWNNPHNSFISSIIHFLGGEGNIEDLLYFFSESIPNFQSISVEVKSYLEQGYKTGFENTKLVEFFPSLNSITKRVFCDVMNELLEHRKNVIESWDVTKRNLFSVKALRYFLNGSVGGNQFQRVKNKEVNNYIMTLNWIARSFESLKSITDFLNLIENLENREFYNEKRGILISSIENFNYKKHDSIIALNRSVSVGNNLASQDNTTLSMLYQIASYFVDSLSLFVKNDARSHNRELSSLIDDFLSNDSDSNKGS